MYAYNSAVVSSDKRSSAIRDASDESDKSAFRCNSCVILSALHNFTRNYLSNAAIAATERHSAAICVAA